ncbi:MAG: laccase domain-containing protein, partial [Gammaproteobacteria bacterium]
VVEATVAAVCARGVDPGSLLAWLGPAIGAAAYEVGAQVTEALGGDDTLALMPGPSGRTHLDLDCLARGRLRGCGVERIYGGGACTHADSTRFFSHRRDGMTGRQASLIWLERAPGHADRLKGGKMAPLSR